MFNLYTIPRESNCSPLLTSTLCCFPIKRESRESLTLIFQWCSFLNKSTQSTYTRTVVYIYYNPRVNYYNIHEGLPVIVIRFIYSWYEEFLTAYGSSITKQGYQDYRASGSATSYVHEQTSATNRYQWGPIITVTNMYEVRPRSN